MFLCKYLWSILLFCEICNGLNQHTQSSEDAKGPIVNTNSGAISGKFEQVLNTAVVSFLGIPYAKPPLEDKRFAWPDPIDNWDDVLLAENKSAACMQYSSRNYEWIPKDLEVSEDCLYLNIWTPGNFQASGGFPVMVWLHGGGFFAGSASMDLYDGSILAGLGNVIVVSINFRVGLFGFLNARVEEAPGNVGFLDQVLALKWINSNIPYFGGDAKRITLFGWSSGSLSVGFHLISPLSQGLFQAAIMQSSSIYTTVVDEDPKKSIARAKSFAIEAGCLLTMDSHEMVECLKQKPALVLAHIDDTNTCIFPTNFRHYFGHSCDGCNPFLPDSQAVMLQKPIQIPIMIGDVKDEATELFLNYIMPLQFPLDRTPEITLEEAKVLALTFFSQMPGAPVEDLNRFYFKNVPETNRRAIVKALANALADMFMNCPSLYLAEKADISYLYWLTHRSEKDPNAKWVGVPHITDIHYIFGKPFRKVDEFTDEDRNFSKNIIDIWSSFAWNHNPVSDPNWMPFQSSDPMVYRLHPKTKGMMKHPRKKACELWRPAELRNITQ